MQGLQTPGAGADFALLAVLSAIGGLLTIPDYLAPLLPGPDIRPEFEHLEVTLMFVSVALALGGLMGAWLLG